ncbi:DMT family transporter [Thioalkalivibrio sp. XN8]|uniref:DMT family transporter n=1 Tax=Thioalkalivibrio sp. XN8 TaxID=2712863 RepID=UPI0013ED7FA6|nr:DMT family transporter [Thioalkalivibrio sp. XN8]NGP53177.1 DMT family transporter [Thioalkalivibrio sp. XN8]
MAKGRRAPDENLVLVALAAFCWGLSGGIAGILVNAGWDATVVAFYRGAIGLLFVFGWLATHPARSGLADPLLWLWAIIAGLGVAGNFTFYFVSIENGSVAVAVTLMYCAPVYVYIVSFVLKLEAPNAYRWLGIGLVMLGIVLLTGIHDVAASGITALGVVAGVLSGMCYALFIFGFKYATLHGSPQAVLTIALAALVAILSWPADLDQVAAVPASSYLWLFILLGVLGAGVSFFLYVVGMRRARPTSAAVVAMIEPITAALFAVAILGETLGGLQLAGMVLILFTVAALSIGSTAHD